MLTAGRPSKDYQWKIDNHEYGDLVTESRELQRRREPDLRERLREASEKVDLGACRDYLEKVATPSVYTSMPTARVGWRFDRLLHKLRAWDLDRYAKVCLLDTDTEPRQRSSSVSLEAPWKRRVPERNGMES